MSEQVTRQVSRGMFWFSYFCFLVAAGSFAFLMVRASSDLTVEGPTGSAVGLLFTAIWAAKEWKKIKVAESSHAFRRAHRLVELRCSVGVAIVLVGAGFYSNSAAKKLDRTRRLDALLAQMDAAQNRNAAAKQQFIEAVGGDTSTINAYISRCEHIELALGEYEPTLREADGQFAQFADLAPNVKLRTQAQFFRKVVGIDLQSVQVFRREIALAKWLPNMPTGKQRLFYQSSIVPIQMEEDRLAEEEIQTIKDAKASGIPLPANLLKLADR